MLKKCLYHLLVFTAVTAVAITITGCEKKSSVSGCKNPLATNYNSAADDDDPCSCRFDGIDQQCGITNPSALIVPPVRQETAEWCWLAVGEMIFRYYQLPNLNPAGDYQCGIVGSVGYSLNGACDACNTNCANCVRPAGNAQMVSYMLSAYPKVACRQLFQSNKTLNSQFVANYLAASTIIAELNAKRPIIAGINPGTQFILPGNSEHVSLIVGYFYYGSNLILVVNDPFPYLITGFDPYIFNGAVTSGNLSYQIPYFNFVNGLKWNTSWYSIGFQ